MREVLDTGLFSSRGDARMGWAHQTYGEFLAALYLFQKGVPAQTTLKALTHPSGGLIPPLAVVAGAWAASLNPELRASLIATDPWTLLRGDLSNWDAGDLAALTNSMLRMSSRGASASSFFGIAEAYEKLKHPELANQLRRSSRIGLSTRLRSEWLSPSPSDASCRSCSLNSSNLPSIKPKAR